MTTTTTTTTTTDSAGLTIATIRADELRLGDTIITATAVGELAARTTIVLGLQLANDDVLITGNGLDMTIGRRHLVTVARRNEAI